VAPSARDASPAAGRGCCRCGQPIPAGARAEARTAQRAAGRPPRAPGSRAHADETVQRRARAGRPGRAARSPTRPGRERRVARRVARRSGSTARHRPRACAAHRGLRVPAVPLRLGRQRPTLQIELDLQCCGSFHASHRPIIYTVELERFAHQLRALDEDPTGEARLEHGGDEIGLTVRLNSGTGTLKGFLADSAGGTLSFENVDIDHAFVHHARTSSKPPSRHTPFAAPSRSTEPRPPTTKAGPSEARKRLRAPLLAPRAAAHPIRPGSPQVASSPRVVHFSTGLDNVYFADRAVRPRAIASVTERERRDEYGESSTIKHAHVGAATASRGRRNPYWTSQNAARDAVLRGRLVTGMAPLRTARGRDFRRAADGSPRIWSQKPAILESVTSYPRPSRLTEHPI
jgi:hypothetical protein